MQLGLSISATWALYLLAGAAVIFLFVAVLPALVFRRRPHRTWTQRTMLSFNISLMVVALSAASGLTWFEDQFGDIPRQEFGEGVLAEPAEAGEPRNFLLVGVDSSAGIDTSNPITAGRNSASNLADSIMVLRVVPETNEASIISFPRDLWLPIAGTGGNDRINTALQAGGPEGLIATLQENFGIPIHHYVQVNFLGFQELVRILGGVPMFFEHPVKDPNTGLYVVVPPEGACVTLDPEQALAFVRSRVAYSTYIDGRWEIDPTSDIGRNRRQQLFIQLALAQAIDKGVRNPSTLQQFIDVGKDHVLLDDSLAVGDLTDLGDQLGGVDPEAVRRYQLPVRTGSVGPASVVFLIDEEAQDELDVFRGVSSTFITPEAVRVAVRNGSGRSGEGVAVQQGLQGAGFTVVSAADAATFGRERTVVRYTPGNQLFAAFLARYLDTNPIIEEVPALGDASIELETGLDFTAIRTEPRPEGAVAELTPATTTTTRPDPDAPTSTSTPSTTATTIGVIPEQPPDADC